jgi:hypothetical protein
MNSRINCYWKSRKKSRIERKLCKYEAFIAFFNRVCCIIHTVTFVIYLPIQKHPATDPKNIQRALVLEIGDEVCFPIRMIESSFANGVRYFLKLV